TLGQVATEIQNAFKAWHSVEQVKRRAAERAARAEAKRNQAPVGAPAGERADSETQIGYLMSPDVESYVEAARRNDPQRCQIMAMSTLASGAIPPREAYDFINRQNVQSVVFGASSARNIRETVSLIDLRYGRAALKQSAAVSPERRYDAPGRLARDSS